MNEEEEFNRSSDGTNGNQVLKISINKKVKDVKWNFHCGFKILLRASKHSTIGDKHLRIS